MYLAAGIVLVTLVCVGGLVWAAHALGKAKQRQRDLETLRDTERQVWDAAARVPVPTVSSDWLRRGSGQTASNPGSTPPPVK